MITATQNRTAPSADLGLKVKIITVGAGRKRSFDVAMVPSGELITPRTPHPMSAALAVFLKRHGAQHLVSFYSDDEIEPFTSQYTGRSV